MEKWSVGVMVTQERQRKMKDKTDTGDQDLLS